MNRGDLRTLSDLRVTDGEVLLNNRCFAGAYYMLGYAVECALKACVAKQIKEFDFPDKKLINDSYTHDLEKLLNIAGSLKLEHQKEMSTNRSFATHWAVVKDWSEDARYEVQVPEKTARDLYSAVTDAQNGVLQWLKKHW